MKNSGARQKQETDTRRTGYTRTVRSRSWLGISIGLKAAVFYYNMNPHLPLQSALNGSEEDMTRKKRDNLVSGGVALWSLVFLLWVIPTFTPPYPGYGVSSALLPNVAFVSILVLSLLSIGLNLFSHLRSKATESEQGPSGDIPSEEKVHLWHLAGFMIPCILLMPAMKWIGFIPSGLLFMLLLQYLCGQRRALTMALVAAGTVGFLYAAMRYGLNVPMP